MIESFSNDIMLSEMSKSFSFYNLNSNIFEF